jgi:hypothetical protein
MLADASLLVALSVQHGLGAESCMSEQQLKKGVERRLRRQVFVDPPRADLRFVVTFETHGNETEARISVTSLDGTPRGTRSLVTTKHCSALDDSLALSVALLVDQPPEPEPELEPPVPPAPAPEAPAARAATSPAPAAAPAPPPPASAKPTTRITIPEDVAAPREPWHATLGAAAQGAWGVVPGIGPGFSLYSSIVPPHFVPTTLAGELFLSRDAARDERSGARFRLLRVSLSLCPPLWEQEGRAVALCVGQKVGWLRVEGYGFDHDLAERRLTYALSVGGEAKQRLFAPVSIRGYLGAEVPVVRDQFASSGRNASQLFQATPIGVTAQLGLEAALW